MKWNKADMDQEENEEDEEEGVWDRQIRQGYSQMGVDPFEFLFYNERKELDPNQEKLIHSQHIYILGDENNGNHDLPLMFLGVSETVCSAMCPKVPSVTPWQAGTLDGNPWPILSDDSAWLYLFCFWRRTFSPPHPEVQFKETSSIETCFWILRDLLSHTVRYAHYLAPELVFTMCSPLRAGQRYVLVGKTKKISFSWVRSFKCASFSGDTQAHIHPPGKPVWTPEPNEMGVDSDENLRYTKFRLWCSDTEGRNFRTVADSA